ncbi:MAG TPA: acyl-homoserine-lactone acylase, partial [Gammaproteobacteria bacterium]|nr:acyl-homoserine-lactone acylase [Gammaproteobacteria bacterium]
DERTIRSLRTRAGLKFVEEVVDTGKKFSQNTVQDLLFNHRNNGAEVFLDDILTVCNESRALRDACSILSSWDRRQDVNSVGAHIFNQFWNNARRLRDHYAVPFNFDDPIHTPNGLTINEQATRDYILVNLEAAVGSLAEADISLDAKWGDVQFAMRNGAKIGIPGGAGGQGMFSVITARFNADAGGYSPITHGNSYIQTVTWSEQGTPIPKAILTYSQSPEPDSEFYSDMTKLYSDSQWIDLPFTDEEIAAKQIKLEVLNF